jgi:hypothetical protein
MLNGTTTNGETTSDALTNGATANGTLTKRYMWRDDYNNERSGSERSDAGWNSHAPA